jgi:asparagine synthase (glutamine-hydrolysing)
MVSKLAARHVKVVLSGDGGDELFGGYDRYVPNARVQRFDAVAGSIGRRAAATAWPLLPHGVTGKNFLRHVAQDPAGRYVESVSFFQADEMQALLSPALHERLGSQSAAAAATERFAGTAHLPWASRMMRFDFDTYLPEDILTKVDRMSMAHSIESRVPLLDHNVVSFAASLPSDMKLRGRARKRVLKQAAASVLPAEVFTRPKHGFGVPTGTWFRSPLRDFVVDTLQSPRAVQRGYFEPAFVDRVVREHLTGRRDHTLRLWQLLMFELWHRQYLDQPPVAHARGSSLPLSRSTVPQKDNFSPGPSLAP